jgi:hypothetical protein
MAGWQTRLRMQQTFIWLPRGLLAGLGTALLLALAARLWPLIGQRDLALASVALALLGVLGAVVGVWLWRHSPRRIARQLDVALGLKARLATAFELAQGIIPSESDALARLQLQQTLQVASGIRAGTSLPLRSDWRWWVGTGIAATLLALAVWLPNPQDQALAQQAQVHQAITQALQELEQIKRQVAGNPALTEAEKQQLTQTLDQGIQHLQQPDVTQPEALAALDSTEQQLRDLSQQFAAERQQALQQASGLLNGTAAQKAADALAQGNLAGAAEALQNLNLNNLSPQQQQQLAQQLGAMASQLADSNPALAQQLGQAADALKNGDTAGAQQALQNAAGEMAQAGTGSTAQVDGYADQAGKAGEGVAGAGKPQPGNQPGQNGMGQSSQIGQAPGGQGNGNQPGQGPGGSGSGRGEGDGNPDPAGAGGNQMPQNNGAGNGGENPYGDVFDPQRIGGKGGDQVDIPGQPDAGQPTGNEGQFTDNPSGQSTVPYANVWGNYSGAVNQALDNGYVPLGLQGLIKDYFSGLDPGK